MQRKIYKLSKLILIPFSFLLIAYYIFYGHSEPAPIPSENSALRKDMKKLRQYYKANRKYQSLYKINGFPYSNKDFGGNISRSYALQDDLKANIADVFLRKVFGNNTHGIKF